jgi:N-sulfoglucosamine sulfohydrolase
MPRLRCAFLRAAGIPLLILTFSFFQDVAEVRAGQAVKARDVRNQRPNILFLIADDWGWNHAGVSGCKWVKTPTFDRIAREGVLFRNAFTSNPKCSPSRATILTGRNSWQLEDACCHYGRFSAKYAVYPDLLAEAGYHVGCTGKGWAPGDWKSGGFHHNPAGPEFNRRTFRPTLKCVGTGDLARNLEDFLKQRRPGQPFCFWIGSNEPHRPYECDSGIRAGKRIEEVAVPTYLPDTDVVRRDLLDYGMEVEWMDKQFGRALAVLEAAGELDRTLVIMTSDHGMPFPRVKGQIFEDGFHVPLAMRWPGHIAAGRVVDDFVNFRDLAPTFLELAGLKPHPQMSGQSLAGLLASPKSGRVDATRDVMLIGKERHDLGRPHDWGYPVRAIRTPEFLFVHNFEPERWPACNPETGLGNCDDGPTKSLLMTWQDRFYDLSFGKRTELELYRVSDDPECLRNLAADPRFAATVRALRARMENLLRQEQDPRTLGNGAVFDTYPYTGPREKNGYDEWLASRQSENPKQTLPARYNVLLIMADDLNCDLACYGNRLVKSPRIDGLAKRGLQFERAYCQFPLCGPSRAALMCGLYPDQTLIHRNSIRIREHLPDVQTLAQMFRKSGSIADRVGKIYHYSVPGGIGTPGHDDPASWDYTVNPRGRDKDDEPNIFTLTPGNFGATLSWLAADGTDLEQTDGIGATAAIRFLEGHAANKTPFFLGMGFYRPHTPYVAPKKYFDLYSPEQMPIPRLPPGYLQTIPAPARATVTNHPEQLHLPDKLAREAIRAYHAATTFMDSQVGRVLDAVDRLKLAENTIIVFTSDHGYHLGEHGHYQKMTLFENAARVPLIISVPGMKTAGQSTAAPAQLIDLYPTLAELCGLPAPAYLSGTSLASVLRDPAARPRSEALTQIDGGYSLRTDRFRYTEWGPDGRDGTELYDHQTDPQEMVNLAGRPDHADTAAVLSGLLHDHVGRARRAPPGLKQINPPSSQKSVK